jgi:acyl carrier protein
MTETQLMTKLTEVFRDVFDDDTIHISDSTTAQDIEAWDSLTHISLVAAVEKAFDATFTTKDIQSLGNVGDFVRLIARKTS